MDNITADNAYGTEEEILAPDEEAVDAEPQDTGDAAGEETAEGAEAPAAEEQDITKTKAFSQRLRERTDRELAREIASAGLINPYNGQRIMTASDLRAFSRMQAAEAAGRDPESAAGEAALLERLGEYQLREQEADILADPELAPYYDEYRDDVLAIAQAAQADGKEVDLELALNIVMAHNLPDIRKRDAERIREETIKNYNARSRATPGAIGGSEAPPKLDFNNMSNDDFDKWEQKALRGELSRSGT